jgi:hypothetical protein
LNYKDTKPLMSAFLLNWPVNGVCGKFSTDFKDWRYFHSLVGISGNFVAVQVEAAKIAAQTSLPSDFLTMWRGLDQGEVDCWMIMSCSSWLNSALAAFNYWPSSLRNLEAIGSPWDLNSCPPVLALTSSWP